jgi:hypothetical protein
MAGKLQEKAAIVTSGRVDRVKGPTKDEHAGRR